MLFGVFSGVSLYKGSAFAESTLLQMSSYSPPGASRLTWLDLFPADAQQRILTNANLLQRQLSAAIEGLQDLSACRVSPHPPGKCWVCGAVADSREHRIKRATLVALYGKGPYPVSDAIFHGSLYGAVKAIQSANATQLKYPPSLCGACNNSRTQPHDRAIDALVDWVLSNEQTLLARRELDFRNIYPEQTDAQIENLLRYFCKEFGCRLYDAEHGVPSQVVEAVRGASPPSGLTIKFAVNEPLAEFFQQGKDPNLIWRHAMYGSLGPTPRPFYNYKLHIRWFTIFVGYRDVGPFASNSKVTPGVSRVVLDSDPDLPWEHLLCAEA